MRFYIDKNKKNFIESLYHVFTIKNTDDIYCAIGKIIKRAQEWERDFRDLCKLCNLSIHNLEIKTLNKMNDKLLNKCVFNKYEHEMLKEVISLRNKVNHEYFCDDEWDCPLDEVEETLKSVYYMIGEGIDYIRNKIDELNKRSIKRPTVFENKADAIEKNNQKKC